MAVLINLKTYSSRRLNNIPNRNWGKLSVLESLKDFPHEIKRVFYIYDADPHVTRGGHRLKKSVQGLVCLSGIYDIFIDNGKEQQNIMLDTPSKMLILEHEDWHTMTNTKPNSILLVVSSDYYDPDEYIDEPYPTTPTDVVKKVYGTK